MNIYIVVVTPYVCLFILTLYLLEGILFTELANIVTNNIQETRLFLKEYFQTGQTIIVIRLFISWN